MHPIYGQKNIAKFIGCAEDKLRECIADGLPIARIGQEYVSVDVDLIDYIRSKYVSKSKGAKCHSTKEANTGGLKSQSTGKSQLESLLGAKTKEKPKKSTTKLSLVSDEKKVTA